MAAPDRQDVIRTRELVLVDAEGRERAKLGMTPAGYPALKFMDLAGKLRLSVYMTAAHAPDPSVPAIRFFDEEGHTRLYVGLSVLGDNPAMIGCDLDEDSYPKSEPFWQTFEAEPTEPTITPEDTLREAGVSTRRQARYQRRMSTLLGRREGA
jgi:hypothetical protein